jgi:hypothetical protein
MFKLILDLSFGDIVYAIKNIKASTVVKIYKIKTMREYKNRYGDVFTFTEDDHQDILWEGDFEWCRIGMPNDYTRGLRGLSKR